MAVVAPLMAQLPRPRALGYGAMSVFPPVSCAVLSEVGVAVLQDPLAFAGLLPSLFVQPTLLAPEINHGGTAIGLYGHPALTRAFPDVSPSKVQEAFLVHLSHSAVDPYPWSRPIPQGQRVNFGVALP